MADKNGNKTGGRTVGTKNKVDSKTKLFYAGLIEKNHAKIEKELDTLEGKTFIDAINSLSEYCLPKLSRVEVEGEIDATLFTIGFGETKKD